MELASRNARPFLLQLHYESMLKAVKKHVLVIGLAALVLYSSWMNKINTSSTTEALAGESSLLYLDHIHGSIDKSPTFSSLQAEPLRQDPAVPSC